MSFRACFFSLICLWVFLVFFWGFETNLTMIMRIYSASSLLLLLEIWVLDCSGKRREMMMIELGFEWQEQREDDDEDYSFGFWPWIFLAGGGGGGAMMMITVLGFWASIFLAR